MIFTGVIMMIYTMMEACKETGMTYQGLKFYCNAGLVPNVKLYSRRPANVFRLRLTNS